MLKVLHTADWHIGNFPAPASKSRTNLRYLDICAYIDDLKRNNYIKENLDENVLTYILTENGETVLSEKRHINAKDVFDAAKEGDKIALDVVDKTAYYLVRFHQPY